MISREYLVEGFANKFVDAYYNFMKNVSKIIDNGEDKSEAIREIIELEIEIAKVRLFSKLLNCNRINMIIFSS